ncbi:phospholipid carrier-dependent glycosyltransferase [Candidatus Fermentibacteria bacterium]|nr:phospholipid carrier-dependent glycosyltransferase [Candidatus Fermentibacteria bacterium]
MNRNLSLAAIVGAAAVVRFVGLGYSVPFHFHIDEQLMLVSTASLVGSPQTAVRDKYFFNYGSVPRLIAGVPLTAAKVAGKLDLNKPRQVEAYYLLARSISALAGTVTVLLVGVMALAAIPSSWALAAPTLLAFSPLHLRDSHFFTPDPMLTMFIVASVAGALWVMRERSVRAAAVMGLCAGLAMATKVNAVFALGSIPVALVYARRRACVVAASAAALGAFLAGNWPMLLAPIEYLRGMELLAAWASGRAVRQTDLQFVGTAPWLYWLGNLLRFGAGPVFWVLGMAGLVFVSCRARGERLLVAATGLPYLVIMGASFQKFMRFSLPLHPVMALTAAMLVAALVSGSRVLRAAVVVLLTAHILVGIAYAGVFIREDPRIRAGRELGTALPPGTAVLLETTHSNPPLIEDDYRKGLFGSYLPTLGQPRVRRSGRFELLYLDPYRYLYEIADRPEEQWACITAAMDSADVIIIGDRYRDQYTRLPVRFPALTRFYRELDGGLLGFELVRVYRNPARIGSFVIDDARSELTFRLFDRPLLKVYARENSMAWRALCTSPG